MRVGARRSIVASVAVGLAVSLCWLWSSGGVLGGDTYKWLASASATLAGFVFTAEQLLMIVLGSEDSRVGRIVRERNPGYLSELLGISNLAVVGYFVVAVLGGARLLFGEPVDGLAATLLSLALVWGATASSMLLFLLIANVQLLYEDYLELDLSRG